jgi:hypothetical protein
MLLVFFGICVMWRGGILVSTDEAKFLLNISYPHPPGVRWLMHLRWFTTPVHVLLWRCIYLGSWVGALWWYARTCANESSRRTLLFLLPLSSAALWLFAGNLLLVSATAIQACLLLTCCEKTPRHPITIGILWLWMLFTSFQAIIFLPMTLWALWQMGRQEHRSQEYVIVYGLIPLGLLCLYTLGNPLAIATILHLDGPSSRAWQDMLSSGIYQWWVGGSGILSILSMAHLWRHRRGDALLSLGLLFTLSCLEQSTYHAVLHVPILLVGLRLALTDVTTPTWKWWGVMGIASYVSIVSLIWIGPSRHSASYATMQVVTTSLTGTGSIAIAGSFGHDWQYWSTQPVVRLTAQSAQTAAAIICLEPCSVPPSFTEQTGAPVPWYRPR